MKTLETKRNRAMLASPDGRRGYTRSASRGSLHHVTRLLDDGRIVCTCEDAIYRKSSQRLDSRPDDQCKHGRLLVAAFKDWYRLHLEEVSK